MGFGSSDITARAAARDEESLMRKLFKIVVLVTGVAAGVTTGAVSAQDSAPPVSAMNND